MADEMKCEGCSATGIRRRMCMCPDGWLYAECQDADTGQIMVITICSPSCLMLFFKPGPGRLTDATKKEGNNGVPLSQEAPREDVAR